MSERERQDGVEERSLMEGSRMGRTAGELNGNFLFFAFTEITRATTHAFWDKRTLWC